MKLPGDRSRVRAACAPGEPIKRQQPAETRHCREAAIPVYGLKLSYVEMLGQLPQEPGQVEAAMSWTPLVAQLQRCSRRQRRLAVLFGNSHRCDDQRCLACDRSRAVATAPPKIPLCAMVVVEFDKPGGGRQHVGAALRSSHRSRLRTREWNRATRSARRRLPRNPGGDPVCRVESWRENPTVGSVGQPGVTDANAA